MLFNSYTFLIFFAVVLALHYSPLSWRLKKFNLLWMSYLFYAAWNPPFVLLLVFSTLVDWILAKKIYLTTSSYAKRILLILSLTVNLGMLAIFKYGQFFVENFQMLMLSVGVEFQPALPDIILPVGISFYTFQTLSYTLDIYRKKIQPSKSFIDYAMYVTFFPQLVAGPIVRAADFLPQCLEERRANASQFSWGVFLIILGMFQKVVLADALLAPAADTVFTQGVALDFWSSWTGALAFAGQIFCDFAGYSTCAIGVAMCLGFALPDNFRFPYAAVGFSDFWRRWHISLSSWLRDYLYISLGGNRRGNIRTYVNLLLTMLIGGLWHGASWTFVIWGALHGSYLILERRAVKLFSASCQWSRWYFQLLLGSITFFAICLAWVFFRAADFSQAMEVVSAMFGFGAEEGKTPNLKGDDYGKVLVTVFCIVGAHAFLKHQSLEDTVNKVSWWWRSLIMAFLLLAIYFNSGDYRAFIYFQF